MSTNICPCCGRPTIREGRGNFLNPPMRAVRKFRAYDDFVPAFNTARRAAIQELGAHWYLVPGAAVWARVPSAWVGCRVFGRVSHAPRDQRFPAARFWPTGELPLGPDYAPAAAEFTASEFREAA